MLALPNKGADGPPPRARGFKQAAVHRFAGRRSPSMLLPWLGDQEILWQRAVRGCIDQVCQPNGSLLEPLNRDGSSAIEVGGREILPCHDLGSIVVAIGEVLRQLMRLARP